MKNTNSQPGSSQNVMDTDRIAGLMIKLSIPVALGVFVQAMYNVVNTIFIGHIQNGTTAIAGLSIVFPLQMLMMGMGMMVGTGGMSVISRAIGAKDTARAERALGNGLTSILIISAVMTVVVLICTDPMLRLMGASEEVLPFARDYLRIIAYGNIFNCTAMILLNFSRAEGNARIGMISQIAASILNIILDAVFILSMNMGVVGAALGTVIAQIAALICLALYYITGNSYLKFRKRNLRLDLKILKPMFAVGASAFVQTVAVSISAIFLISSVVSHGGDIALSAFGIAQRMMMFVSLPAMVIGMGVQPILGYNYGAKRYLLALKALKLAAVSSTLASVVVFLILMMVPEPIIRIFTSDPILVDAGVHCCRMVFMSLPIMGIVMIGSSCFQSVGKAIPAFILAIARPVGFMVPLIFILPNIWQLNGVYATFPVSDVLTFLLTIILIYPLFKEFRKAAAKEKESYPIPVASQRANN